MYVADTLESVRDFYIKNVLDDSHTEPLEVVTETYEAFEEV